MNNVNNFYTILPSNSCPRIHPDNKASKFIVELDNPIYLNGNWEVALMDFTFLYNTFQIYSEASVKIDTGKSITKDILIFISNEDNRLICDDPDIEIVNGDDMIVIGNYHDYVIEFENLEVAKRFGFNKVKIDLNSGGIIPFKTFKNNKDIENVHFKLTYSKGITSYLKFENDLYIKNLEELDEFMKYIFKDVFKTFRLKQNELFHFSLQSHVKSITFDRVMTKTLGLNKNTFTQTNLNYPHPEQIFTGIRNPKIISNPHQMFIYSNIVEPIIVGDTNVPLLKSVWLESYVDDQLVQIIVKNPMYLPLATSCINNIEINIRNDNGDLIKFDPEAKTHLTLHFRKTNV